jgi:hypothetical protein
MASVLIRVRSSERDSTLLLITDFLSDPRASCVWILVAIAFRDLPSCC